MQNSIPGSLPSGLAGLPSLRVLDLSSNALAFALPEAWGPNLQLVGLGGNNFSGKCAPARFALHTSGAPHSRGWDGLGLAC